MNNVSYLLFNLFNFFKQDKHKVKERRSGICLDSEAIKQKMEDKISNDIDKLLR